MGACHYIIKSGQLKCCMINHQSMTNRISRDFCHVTHVIPSNKLTTMIYIVEILLKWALNTDSHNI